MNGHNMSSVQRILGRVSPHEFVGRTDELAQIVAQGTSVKSGRGLLLLMEPSAGVSELLRQAYDQVFSRHSDIVPIYFAFTRNDPTAVSAAIEFLNAFLQQYIAFRRDDPSLSRTPLTLQDLVALAPPSDLEWVEQLVDSYNKLKFSNDDKALVRFCLAAPGRIPSRLGRPFVMLDGAELAENLNGSVTLGTETLRVFGRSSFSFVVAGLRRQILRAAHDAECDFEMLDLLRLERLEVDESSLLVERVAHRHQVVISEEARDLIVNQFSGSPLFITNFLQAARERGIALNSYLECERLYVDDVLGGHIQRHFADLLEQISPTIEVRQSLIRLLWEAYAGDTQTASFDSWRKRLRLSAEDLENLLHGLHVQEFVNWDGATVEAVGGPQAWRDYVKVRYRLDVLNEPRALVVAESLTDALKRAPTTMARHYKQLARLDLRDLLSGFNCQRVPSVLFDFASFRKKYHGASDKTLADGVAGETDLIRLPQTVHVASCIAFNADMRQICEDERCVVAHAFKDGSYVDAQEIIWLAAEIESKLELEPGIVEVWCDRLERLANDLGFGRYQIWLTAREGFSEGADQYLKQKGVFSSSRRQIELLAAQVGDAHVNPVIQTAAADEFLVVAPMGEDNELIAASTAEQIARRLSFKPEAINQIKTAIVEACINAAEHSFSPDRKIYQRFRVENDRLVVTISSRGIVPTALNGQGTDKVGSENDATSEGRRGWGLKLIKTLMDEVEFERVDEGTSLRMTKYLRNSSS